MFTILPHHYFLVQKVYFQFLLMLFSVSFPFTIACIRRSITLIMSIYNNCTIVCIFFINMKFIILGTKHILQSKLNIFLTTDDNFFRSGACTITANGHTTESMKYWKIITILGWFYTTRTIRSTNSLKMKSFQTLYEGKRIFDSILFILVCKHNQIFFPVFSIQ